MIIKRKSLVAAAAALLLTVSLSNGFADSGSGSSSDENGGRGRIEYPLFGDAPKGLPSATAAAARHAASTASSKLTAQYGIQFNGGAVMNNSSGVNVYLVWYGNWGTDTAKTILPNFLTNLSNSPYFAINRTYTDANGVAITPIIRVAGQYTYSNTNTYGTNLSDASVIRIAKGALGQSGIPSSVDANALYFVLTAPGIRESSGFLSAYCGWHSSETMDYLNRGSVGTPPTTNMKYSFVGDAANASGCGAQNFPNGSPNNNVGADGMASVIAHELEETITDPDGNGWWVSNTSSRNVGMENGDMCAWKFGTTSQQSSTATYSASVSGARSNGNATATVSSATNNSTTRRAGTTITYNGANTFAVNQLVTVTVAASPYNVTNQVISARTANSFTVNVATPANTPTLIAGSYTATVSGAGTQITYTYNPAAGQAFAVGDRVTVTTNVGAYSVTNAAITAVTATTFTVAANVPAGTPAPTLPVTATATRTTLSGPYNMTLGGSNYLIQQNWANRSPNGSCTLS